MKNILIPVCFTALLACNNNTKETTSNDTDHNTHNTVSTSEQRENVMKKIMDEMMHEMHAGKPTGNNDVDFSQMMIAHHQGAVKMSEELIRKGNDPELKKFAQTVINDQNKEIDFMKEFISSSAIGRSANTAEFQKALNNSMMSMMSGTTMFYNNVDKDFAAQMIPHHQSAVDMAKAYLDFGKTEALMALCRNIIETQTSEISMLNAWLAKNK